MCLPPFFGVLSVKIYKSLSELYFIIFNFSNKNFSDERRYQSAINFFKKVSKINCWLSFYLYIVLIEKLLQHGNEINYVVFQRNDIVLL